MEFNIIFIHKHRYWNNNIEGHKENRIYGHGIACYGHFLTDFLLNLINIIPYNTKNVIINLTSNLPGDYEINPKHAKEGNPKNSVKMMENLNEIYPNIKLNCGVFNKELSLEKSHNFLRFCEMDSDMIRERLIKLRLLIKKINKEVIQNSPSISNIKALFITRGNEKILHSRKIGNLNIIYNLFKKKLGDKLMKIQAENYSLKLQIYYFSNSNLIIGAGGSGLFNALFMKPQSYIITNLNNCHTFRILCLNVSLKYLPWFIYKNILNNNHISQNSGNLFIDVNKLKNILNTNKANVIIKKILSKKKKYI